MIKAIFGILCILAGIFWSIVSIYGMYDSLNDREKRGVILAIFLMIISAITLTCGIRCFL